MTYTSPRPSPRTAFPPIRPGHSRTKTKRQELLRPEPLSPLAPARHSFARPNGPGLSTVAPFGPRATTIEENAPIGGTGTNRVALPIGRLRDPRRPARREVRTLRRPFLKPTLRLSDPSWDR
jgi:hypothetical protein